MGTGNTHHLIRKIDPEGQVSNFAGQRQVCGDKDGTDAGATLCYPQSIVIDQSGNLYVWQTLFHAPTTQAGAVNSIRKVSPGGEVTTIASRISSYPTVLRGLADAYHYEAGALAIDSKGVLYAADPSDHIVRRYQPDGSVAVLAGSFPSVNPGPDSGNAGFRDGTGAQVRFGNLVSIAVDAADRVYVLDAHEDRRGIRRIDPDGT